MAKHVVARTQDILPGERRLVSIKGRPIVIFNIDGEFFGLLNRCPHMGGELRHGRLGGLLESSEPGHFQYSRQGEILRCPWHSWEFDVRTGKSWCRPDRVRVRQFDVKIERGDQVVEGPYIVETFAITVEDDYVTVEV